MPWFRPNFKFTSSLTVLYRARQCTRGGHEFRAVIMTVRTEFSRLVHVATRRI